MEVTLLYFVSHLLNRYCNNDELSKIKVKLVHKDWACQECMPRKGTKKLVEDEVEVALKRINWYLSKTSTNCESSEVRHSPLYKDVIPKDYFTWL